MRSQRPGTRAQYLDRPPASPGIRPALAGARTWPYRYAAQHLLPVESQEETPKTRPVFGVCRSTQRQHAQRAGVRTDSTARVDHLLPSGLYRRPRLTTGSAPPRDADTHDSVREMRVAGSARGVSATTPPALPPIGNCLVAVTRNRPHVTHPAPKIVCVLFRCRCDYMP